MGNTHCGQRLFRVVAMVGVVLMTLVGCGSPPSEATQATSTELKLDLGAKDLPRLPQPISASERDALRRSFSWSKAKALAEKAANGEPALHYVVIELENREQAQALDQIGMTWSEQPLFGEERLAWAPGGGVYLPGEDLHGTFVFALMPARVFNVLRDAAHSGKVLFPLVALRSPPASVPLSSTGALSLKWLYARGYCYPGTCAPVASPAAGTSSAALTEVLSEVVTAAARAGSGFIDAILELFGLIVAAVSPSTAMTFSISVFESDPDFAPGTPTVQVWGAARGTPISLAGAELVMQQIELPIQFRSRLDGASRATLTVPNGRRYGFCLRTETAQGRVTGGFLPALVCGPIVTVAAGAGPTTLTVGITDPTLNALATIVDGRRFLLASMQLPARPATVLVGNMANLLAVGGTAFAPGLGGRDPGSVLAATGLDVAVIAALSSGAGVPLLGIPPGVIIPGADAFALAMRMFLNVDIVLPDAQASSRIIRSHEFGHHAFYQMMNIGTPPDAFAQHLLTIIGVTALGAGRDPAIDATPINEGIADWVAVQLSGGGNRLRGVILGTAYVGDLRGAETYCAAIPGCLDSNVTGVPLRDPLNDRASQVSTLIHDLFDGPVPLGPNQPHNGAAWTPVPAGCLMAPPACTPSLPLVAPPTPTLLDEPVTVGGVVLPTAIRLWLIDPIEGRIFSLNTLMHGLTRTLRASGTPEGAIRSVYALHNAGAVPAAWLAP